MSSANIERFTSWDEIFPDPAEAERQYENFLASLKEDYDPKRTKNRTEIDPKTGLEVTIFEGGGVHTLVQRLRNRNVSMQFSSGGVKEIVPEVGNKNHDWTDEKVNSIYKDLIDLYESKTNSPQALGLCTLAFRLKGKPATRGWEDIFVYGGMLPQRIGYQIYPEEELRSAQIRLGQYEIEQITRPISTEKRQSLLNDLRSYPSDIDGNRIGTPWEKANIYFHTLQDTFFATSGNLDLESLSFSKRELNKLRKRSQACFVKDFDYYFAGFPEEEREMREFFQAVFDAGTSTYWHQDVAFVDKLNEAYWKLNEECIKPWIRKDPNN